MALLSVTEFVESGLRVSDDIRDAEIQMAIDTCEKTYIVPLITKDYYTALVTSSLSDDDYEVVNGNDSIMGLKMAIAHCVFAYLLYDRIQLTRYSAVIKEDEHSSDPSESDIMSICSNHWEVGMQNVIDALVTFGHEPSTELTPQPPFMELAFNLYRKERRN